MEHAEMPRMVRRMGKGNEARGVKYGGTPPTGCLSRKAGSRYLLSSRSENKLSTNIFSALFEHMIGFNP
jgi:hypothetical protein